MAGRRSEKNEYTTTQLLNFARDSYLERTSRPVYAIVFLLPFIIFYELGTALINTDILSDYEVRVVAFVWLQDFMVHLGTSSRLAWIAPPIVVILMLIGLQIASGKEWYFCPGDYTPMIFECIFLAVPMILLSLFFNSPPATPDNQPPISAVDRPAQVSVAVQAEGGVAEPALRLGATRDGGPGEHRLLTNIVTGVGAGIYEELVFRLILICALMVLFQDVIGLSHQNAVVLAVLISAGLFSAHHDIQWLGGRLGRRDDFTWIRFAFRTIAGVYFAILFAIRGFGITAGTHAFYDIIATIVNALFFEP